MKLLFLILTYTIPLLVNSSDDYDWDTNPFICAWTIEKGKSFYKCNDGKTYDDYSAMFDSTVGKSYTSIRQESPDDVKWDTGFEIDIKLLKQGFREKFNKYNLIHRGSGIKQDANLEEKAQKRAEELMASYNGVSPDSSNSDGESTACVHKDVLVLVPEQWYKQNEKFDFSNPEGNKGKGVDDFTRMVWRKTYNVGCGFEHKGPIYCVACAYSPEGNRPGSYEENVRKANEPGKLYIG